jgi:flagellar hook-associated protein 3 FlgL
MGLRIAPDLYSTMLYNVNADQTRLNNDLEQLSTGQSVNEPSDNPVSEAAYIENQAQSSEVDEYTQNISTVQGGLQTADATLQSVINNLNQALTIGNEGASGTNSTTELQGLAAQVQAIQQTVMGLANTSYQGAYLFSGTNSTTVPYVTSSTSSSGVAYQGNSDTTSIQVGPGQTVQTNLPGSSIFGASGADVFQALHDLSQALSTNTNITGALSEVTAAYNNVNSQATFYGNAIDQLDEVNTNLSEEQSTLSQQASNLISANIATVASNLSQDETTLQAALQGFASISQDTLFSYLKL